MLPVAWRLPLRHEKDFFARAQRLHSKAFVIFWTPSPALRFAVITRKTLGSAVERNRIRRQTRSLIRSVAPMTPFRGDIAILPRPSQLPFQEKKSELEALLRRLA